MPPSTHEVKTLERRSSLIMCQCGTHTQIWSLISFAKAKLLHYQWVRHATNTCAFLCCWGLMLLWE